MHILIMHSLKNSLRFSTEHVRCCSSSIAIHALSLNFHYIITSNSKKSNLPEIENKFDAFSIFLQKKKNGGKTVFRFA